MDYDGEISSNVKKGLRRASGLNDDPPEQRINFTIPKQRRFFEGTVPGIEGIFDGTINMDISPREFVVLKPDHEVTCEWEEGIEETFWFVRGELSHKGRSYEGWIYYPCPSPVKEYTKNDMIEFLAPRIEGLQYGDSVLLRYSTEKFQVK